MIHIIPESSKSNSEWCYQGKMVNKYEESLSKSPCIIDPIRLWKSASNEKGCNYHSNKSTVKAHSPFVYGKYFERMFKIVGKIIDENISDAPTKYDPKNKAYY